VSARSEPGGPGSAAWLLACQGDDLLEAVAAA
jgi:hypothetical protein